MNKYGSCLFYVYYLNEQMIEQVLSYFKFNTIELIGISLLLILFLIILFFYLHYYRMPYKIAKKDGDTLDTSDSGIKVSVVIVSENEVESLRKNLPDILSQDYKNFEVIVVNNGSTDESDELLLSMELQYPNLYHTYLPYSADRKLARKKLALTLGFKAAKGDILLLTEPYCKPTSDKWISSIAHLLTPEKEVVLGYSYYKKEPHFYNRIARFDNLLFSMQYLSMALKNKPYTGVFRNIAFRRQLFFDRKGFASLLNLENGEEIFINSIMTNENTVVALSQDSFMETSLEHYSLWRQIKKAYSVAKNYFKNKAGIFTFGIEVFCSYAFYLVFIALTLYSVLMENWALLGIGILILLMKTIIQSIIISKVSTYFYSGRFRFSFILMDIIQPMYNLKLKSWGSGRLKVNK